ncbi:MAG: hypothetical protein C0478_17765 [Planctomyces sp.]|nr:hypothetical protein [Planctomyces sp.]
MLLLTWACPQAHAGEITPFAEVLIWHASEETSSTWASVVSETPSGSPDPRSVFAAQQLDFNWSPGFRVGVNIAPETSNWDWTLALTNFSTSQGAEIPDGDHLVLPEFFSGFVSGDGFSFTTASLDWSIRMTTFDIEAGHDIQVLDDVTIRPVFGLKIASIRQSLQSRWGNPSLGLTAVEDVNHDFFGVGPSFGVGGTWHVPGTSGLRVVGSCSGALMYGTWNVTDDFQRTDPGLPLLSYDAFSTTMNDAQLGTVMIRSFVGLEWTLPGKLELTAWLGYEAQWWANQQRLLTFQQLPMHGDLTLQGGSCGLAVCY